LQAFMTEHKAQFTADMEAFVTQAGADFNTWFDGIKGILGEDEAGNLLNLINTVSGNLSAHASDTTSHTTADQKTALAAAIQSATLGGAAVTKAGTVLQFPAYPTSLPANGGTAAACSGTSVYATYSSHAIGSTAGFAVRSSNAGTGSATGGQDGDAFDQYV
jgi:hypothetical protein